MLKSPSPSRRLSRNLSEENKLETSPTWFSTPIHQIWERGVSQAKKNIKAKGLTNWANVQDREEAVPAALLRYQLSIISLTPTDHTRTTIHLQFL